MLSRWPIRRKLFLGITLLLVTVSILACSGLWGGYAYRALARVVSQRASELPLTTDLALRVSDLRATFGKLGDITEILDTEPLDCQWLRPQFGNDLMAVHAALDEYRKQLNDYRQQYRGNPSLVDVHIGDYRGERDKVQEFELALARIDGLQRGDDWTRDEHKIDQLKDELQGLRQLAAELPSFLQQHMRDLQDEVRLQYRTWIIITWVTSLLAALMLCLLGRLFYTWVLYPLRLLIQGSRRVAGGEFNHRIHLPAQDEMSELAGAMNQMTIRFQEIRDDLDRQVRQRTKQVVRNEQLASVGFLAAGVAHEINNPLASIALCAESLEDRLHDIIQQDDARPDHEHNQEISILRNYLRMIQDEAFRCKEITERLLDFSRLGEAERQNSNLSELVRHVVEMVGHIGTYKEKRIELLADDPVLARVNAQEIKQVVLNLLTNALDSTDRGGTVSIELSKSVDQAELSVTDDGCGMTPEVLEHVFEPFYTRRRDGQGTGLGLSISCRIIADHGGHIDAHSDGPGRGSRFRVLLPLAVSTKEQEDRHQAA
jgi:signal transduction histidine kinase